MSNFEAAAQELTDELVTAEIDTVSKLLQWKEVVDRKGFQAIVENLTDTVKRHQPERGDAALQVVISYALVLGARCAREGLL